MGTKIDIETVEGMRKVTHDMIERVFNAVEKTPDGKPVDAVNLQQEMHTYRTEGGSFLAEGTTITLHVKYRHPVLRVAPNTEMVVRTPEGVFRLIDPTEPRINHLVQVLIGLRVVDHEAGAIDMLAEGKVFETNLYISALAQISALMFERTVLKEAPEPETPPEVEYVPDGEPKTTGETTIDAGGMAPEEVGEFIEEFKEAAAKQRYEEALARGLSDAEAREEGWPSKTEE